MRKKCFAGLLIALLCAVSCDGLLEGLGGKGDGQTVLQPDEQKVKLEEVAIELMDKCPPGDLERYLDFTADFVGTYLDDNDYDFSAFEEWAEDFEDITVEELKYVEKFDEAKQMYVKESILNFTILLSNYSGSFELKKDRVVMVNGNHDGIKVTFPLNGKTYVAEIQPSANTTRATFEYMSKHYWTEVDWYYDVLKNHYDNYLAKFSINVPDNIRIRLTEDGKAMADVNVNMTQSFSASGLNPTVDNFNAEVTVSFDNGYALKMENVGYDGASSTAKFSFEIKKNGETLLASSAVSDVAIELTTYEYDNSYDGRLNKGEYTWVELKKAKTADVSFDILGKIQFKGSCSNIMEISDFIDAFYEAANSDDKTKMDRAINNINSKFDLSLYYDKGSAVQAKVVFEYEKIVWDSYHNEYSYDIVPVIVFGDNSRYAFEDYFTERSFENVLDRFDDFGEDYEDLFGTILDDIL